MDATIRAVIGEAGFLVRKGIVRTLGAVERQISSIFRKLGLADSNRLNRRVKEALLATARRD